MLNKVFPRSITAESAGGRCCAGNVSPPPRLRCPWAISVPGKTEYKMSTARTNPVFAVTRTFTFCRGLIRAIRGFIFHSYSVTHSEQELQSKLNLPWSVASRHCCNLAEIGVSETRLWPVEYRMVCQIERLGTELQIVVFRKFENLVERQIDHALVRSITNVARGVAQLELGGLLKSRGVKPLSRAAGGWTRHPDVLADEVWTFRREADDAAHRILVRNRERQSRLPDRATVDLPSAQHQAGSPFQRFRERQL